MISIHEQITDYSEWQDTENPVAPMRRSRYLADLLILSGYRGISNRYCIVSRIDRPDWLTHMAIRHSPWSFDQGMSWAVGLGVASAADHYIGCYTQDKIQGIPETIYRMVKKAPTLVDYHEIAEFIPRRRGIEL